MMEFVGGGRGAPCPVAAVDQPSRLAKQVSFATS